VTSCRQKDSGFTYLPYGGGVAPGCTAAGVLHQILDGTALDRQDMQALRDVVIKQIGTNPTFPVYTAHFQAQVLSRFPGKEAETGLTTLRDRVLQWQTGNGSFESNIGGERLYGPVVPTALAILALTAKDHNLAVMKVEKQR
jgi:hypothetical protein